MFKKLSEQLKANPRTIVFTEGTDARILEAADKLTAEGVLGVILLGKADEVKAAAKETGFNIDKCQIIDGNIKKRQDDTGTGSRCSF